MEQVERERMVADAILLERAATVYDRRKGETGGEACRIDDETTAFKLRSRAHRLRREAGQSVEDIRLIRTGSRD